MLDLKIRLRSYGLKGLFSKGFISAFNILSISAKSFLVSIVNGGQMWKLNQTNNHNHPNDRNPISTRPFDHLTVVPFGITAAQPGIIQKKLLRVGEIDQKIYRFKALVGKGRRRGFESA